MSQQLRTSLSIVSPCFDIGNRESERDTNRRSLGGYVEFANYCSNAWKLSALLSPFAICLRAIRMCHALVSVERLRKTKVQRHSWK